MKKIFCLTFLVVFLLCTITSCVDDWWKDDEFSLQKTPYTGNELRLDGYYYCELPMVTDLYSFEVIFFYRNGICYKFIAHSHEKINEALKNSRKVKLELQKANWGLFTINGNTIKFEFLYLTDELRKPVFVRKGIVLNDSTFHINESYRSDGSEQSKLDETYHFRQFSPKPDSTNNFIK
jgi:hypothetical protein